MAKSNNFQRTWKPVDLRPNAQTESNAKSQMSVYRQSVRWYENIITLENSRAKRLHRYNQMDSTTDISRPLDIMAEDMSSDNAENDEIFMLEFEDEHKIKKSTMKTLESLKNVWQERTEFDVNFFEYCREALKYGCVMFQVNEDSSLTKLIQERVKGYIIDQKDNNKVTHYIYDENATYTNENGDKIESKNDTNQNQEQELLKIPVEDMLIMKVGSGPFGTSVLDRVYRTWRQLQLVEDAIVIYRIVRAPERRVFYIDTGRLSGTKATNYVRRFQHEIRQKQVARGDDVETQYNPQSMQEDYYIPKPSGSDGSRVETLEGGQNLGEISDLSYLNNKIALGLRVPHSYMPTYSPDAQSTQWNDGKVGIAYIEELRYTSYIERIQRKMAIALYWNFKKFVKKFSVPIPDGTKFKICEPQSFAVYKENDVNNALLNTFTSAASMPQISKRFAMKKYLNMDTEELEENEHMKLLEQGYTEDKIKALSEPERYKAVYGGDQGSGF